MLRRVSSMLRGKVLGWVQVEEGAGVAGAETMAAARAVKKVKKAAAAAAADAAADCRVERGG
jgi:hypothetical protein